MLNYASLSDVEFEYLCGDVLSAILGVQLHRYAKGRDGGIDLRDGRSKTVVQVKHYYGSSVDSLISSLRKEVPKVKEIAPEKYYVCVAKELSPAKVDEIYELFSDYMESRDNIFTLTEIENFLTSADGAQVLRKHYKLWISSTGILEELFTRDICIDGEVLMANIKSELELFVQTDAYEAALACLKKNRAILIIGDPGVGKTITSKMLALHFLSEGYRLRYTTAGEELSSLKRALTSDRDAKEIIFLDDCFGQAYFSMKETQGGELLSVIKHVNLHPNKLLIMNSRVTIYREAKERTPDMVKSFDYKEYRLFLLDMGKVNAVDKARILYNHLYFGVDAEHFGAVRENGNYRSIVLHANYNPRIIEYVSNPSVYKEIPPEKYCAFISEHLRNPQKAWRDEYERRLRAEDRMLLTTLYSLTDTMVELDTLKRCFEQRIKSSGIADVSVNVFRTCLTRLQKAFVKIVDSGGKQMISMANPSVNDFLSAFMKDNIPERDAITESARAVRQLRRLLPDDEFFDRLRKVFEDGSILSFCFSSEESKTNFIAYGVSKFGTKRAEYRPYILKYLSDIDAGYRWEIPEAASYKATKGLLAKDVFDFYGLKPFFLDSENVHRLFSRFWFEESIDVLPEFEGVFGEDERKKFLATVSLVIERQVISYCENLDADEFDPDYDELFEGIDWQKEGSEWRAEEILMIDCSNMAMEYLESVVRRLPKDMVFSKGFPGNVLIDVSGADLAVKRYIAEEVYGEPISRGNFGSDRASLAEIDLIFK